MAETVETLTERLTKIEKTLTEVTNQLSWLIDEITLSRQTGLFSFRLFVHFRRKVAIRRSLGQRKVLD